MILPVFMAPVTDFTSASLQANPIIARHMKTMPAEIGLTSAFSFLIAVAERREPPGVANPYCMFP